MKDIKAILEESGATLTDEQAKAICDAVGLNYRSKEETDKKASRIKELEEANANLSKQVEETKGDSEELETLRKTVADYKEAEEKRNAEEEEQKKRDQFMTVFNAAVGEQEFANDLIMNTVFEKVYAKCSETTGADAKSILEDTVRDMDGVYKNPQHDPAKMPSPEDVSKKKPSEKEAKKTFADMLFSANR